MTESTTPDTPDAAQAAPEKPAETGISTPAIIAIVVVMLVVGGCLVAKSLSKPDHSGAAIVACHDAVKEQLKSPASADFSDEDVSHDGDVYTLTGSVDADNSFGAPIRNDYTCTATWDDSVGDFGVPDVSGLVN